MYTLLYMCKEYVVKIIIKIPEIKLPMQQVVKESSRHKTINTSTIQNMFWKT